MLASEALELDQLLLQLLEARRVGLGRVQERAQETRRRLELRRGLADAASGLLHRRNARAPAVQDALGALNDLKGGAVLLREPLHQASEGGRQLGRVAQELPLAAQVLGLHGVEVERLQLAELELDQVQALGAPLLLGLTPLEPLAQAEPGRAALAIARQGLPQPGKGVQQLQLLGRLEQPLVLVLPVDLHQLGRQLAEELAGHRAMVHVGPTAPIARDGPREDKLQLARRLALGALLLTPLLEGVGQVFLEPARHALPPGVHRQQEAPLHPRTPRARPHDLRARPTPEQQLERIHDQALARARLPRDGVETGTEDELGLLEEGQVLEAEFDQHGGRCCLEDAETGCELRLRWPRQPQAVR